MRRTLPFLLVLPLFLGCVGDDANGGKSSPSIPISIGDAWIAPGIVDAGLIVVPERDAAPAGYDVPKDTAVVVKRDTAVPTPIPDATAPTGGMCDLLKQNCPSKALACYPVSGGGMCQTAGGVGEGGPCYQGSDTPLCAPGLACVTGILQGAVCLVICDVFNPVPYCGIGNVCQPLPKFTTIGYCQPG